MKRNYKFERTYLKCFVKSSKLFWLYITIFLLIFITMSNSTELVGYKSYTGNIKGKEVVVKTETPISLLDNKLYIYTDKNREVLVSDTRSIEYGDGKMYFILNKEQKQMDGNVTVEIAIGKKTLLQSIISKVRIEK